MARHILMAGKSDSDRRNLEASLLATYDDVVISEVNNVEQAKAILSNNAIHLVIYALEADDTAGLDFCAGIAAYGPEGLMPCIILAYSELAVSEAVKQGLDSVLKMPCSSTKLVELINKVCNPVHLRKAKRYSIQGTEEVIEQRNLRLQSVVLNISSGGVLCEFEPLPMFNLCDPVMITLQFMENNPILSDTKIYAILSNMKVVECNSDYTPFKIRAGFKFIFLPQEALEALNLIFDNADSA